MAHFEVSTVTAKHVNNLTVIYEQRLRARTFFSREIRRLLILLLCGVVQCLVWLSFLQSFT